MSSITVKPLSYLFTKAPLQDEDYAGFISKLISNCLFFPKIVWKIYYLQKFAKRTYDAYKTNLEYPLCS